VSQLRFTDDALQSVSMPHALRRSCEFGRALILAQRCKSIRLDYRRSSPHAIVRRALWLSVRIVWLPHHAFAILRDW